MPKKTALYTPEERARRDASPWTLVQAILAPLQFLVFAISLALVLRFLLTGEGYVVATASILAKTLILYLIMITGSVWEKEVFGKWLFARAFFWEDVFSMLVLALHTIYLAALLNGWGTPQEQMLLAIAAYATYVINAGQFLLKLREARLEALPKGERDAVPPTAHPGERRDPAFFAKTLGCPKGRQTRVLAQLLGPGFRRDERGDGTAQSTSERAA